MGKVLPRGHAVVAATQRLGPRVASAAARSPRASPRGSPRTQRMPRAAARPHSAAAAGEWWQAEKALLEQQAETHAVRQRQAALEAEAEAASRARAAAESERRARLVAARAAEAEADEAFIAARAEYRRAKPEPPQLLSARARLVRPDPREAQPSHPAYRSFVLPQRDEPPPPSSPRAAVSAAAAVQRPQSAVVVLNRSGGPRAGLDTPRGASARAAR